MATFHQAFFANGAAPTLRLCREPLWVDQFRSAFGDRIAHEVLSDLDQIDRSNLLHLCPGWRPLAFDPSLPPVPPMERIST